MWQCNSPANMAIRLNDKHPVTAHFLRTPMTKLSKELQLYYEEEKHREKHLNPKTGDVVIVKNMGRYERVLISSVDANGKKIEVRLLDSGIEHLTYNPSQLFVCKPDFKVSCHRLWLKIWVFMEIT